MYNGFYNSFELIVVFFSVCGDFMIKRKEIVINDKYMYYFYYKVND